MIRAYISLGSNLGDRKKNILDAVQRMGQMAGTTVRRLSRLRETPAAGRRDQPAFLNAVAEIETSLSPQELLEALQSVERDLGRRRAERWAPRPIDLDLLIVGDVRLDSPALTLPHPRIKERGFVLEPLAELAPDLVIPGDDRTVRERLASLSEGLP